MQGFFLGDESVLKWIAVVVTHVYDIIKSMELCTLNRSELYVKSAGRKKERLSLVGVFYGPDLEMVYIISVHN